jgi:small redox-active disulfide protein 2
MEIKILGSGCARCQRLEELTLEAVNEAGVEADVVHVTDMQAILAYSIVSTPGLVINEEVKSSGRLPRKGEIVAWLKAAAA